MKNLIVLLLASILLLPMLSRAAEALPQPEAQDWRILEIQAKEIWKIYGSLVNKKVTHVIRLRKELEEKPANSGELKLALAGEERIVEAGRKAVTALETILTQLQQSKEVDCTREKYLQLRRQIKGWQVQWQIDQRQRYSSPGQPSGYDLSFEERLQLQKVNPPETIPVGPRPQGLSLDWQTLPRLDGSTTAQPLSALIVCRMLGLSAVWQYRPIYDRSTSQESPERILIPQCAGSPLPSDAGVDSYYESGSTMFPGLRLSLAMTGTNNAYRNLILGAADFIIVARPPSSDEKKLAKEKGIELDSRTIASDAFIFILNRANPVNSLTVQQIQNIYQDNVLRWSEVGGNKDKLVAFQRERNSGSQETMQELVMKDLTMAPPVEQLIGSGMGGPYNRLNHESNGISYTFYYYHTVQSPVNQARPARPDDKKPAPPIKVCAVNGILPTPETIRNRTYPYVTEVYAIVRKGTAEDSPAIRLRDWLLTPEGQALVQESGYVPLPAQ